MPIAVTRNISNSWTSKGMRRVREPGLQRVRRAFRVTVGRGVLQFLHSFRELSRGLLRRTVCGFWLNLLGLFSLVVFSQEPSAQLKTSVDATTITVGDVVSVKLEVKHAESLKIAFPVLGATLGEWVVRGSGRLPSKPPAGGLVEDVLALQITIFKTGEFEVPAIQVETVQPDGTKSVLTSDPIKIKVQSVLTGKEDTLKEVKPQAQIEADYKPFLLLLAALASAAFLIYRLIERLRHRKKDPAPIPQDVRTPEEIARAAIQQLLARRLVEQEHFKEFYLELSEIIKRFLGSKLNIASLERTTEEFVRDLRETRLSSSHYQMIREFLDDCDLVKFAKYRPGGEEVRRVVDRSMEIVDVVAAQANAQAPLLEVSR